MLNIEEVAMVVTIATVLATIIALWSLVFLCLRRHRSGESNLGRVSVSVTTNFWTWCLVAIQQLAQAMRVPTVGLPGWWADLVNALQLVRLDMTGVLPPECTSTYAFLLPLLSLLTCLLLSLVSVSFLVYYIASYRKSKMKGMSVKRCSLASWTVRMCLLGTCLSYSLGVVTALDLLQCQFLDDGPARWSINPGYYCYSGDHLPVAALAWIELAVQGTVFPILLLVGAAKRVELEGVSRSGQRAMKSTEEKGEDVGKRGSIEKGWCNRICELMCRVREEVHSRLREDVKWTAVFQKGQPWFRTASLLLLFSTAGLDTMVRIPAGTQQKEKAASRLAAAGVLIIFAIVVLCLRPYHRMVEWQRWPSFALGVAAATVLAFQACVFLDIRKPEPTALGSTNEGIPDVVLSDLSVALFWVVCVVLALLPVILTLSFVSWFLGVLGLRVCRWAVRGSSSSIRGRVVTIREFTDSHGARGGRKEVKGGMQSQPSLVLTSMEHGCAVSASQSPDSQRTTPPQWITNPLSHRHAAGVTTRRRGADHGGEGRQASDEGDVSPPEWNDNPLHVFSALPMIPRDLQPRGTLAPALAEEGNRQDGNGEQGGLADEEMMMAEAAGMEWEEGEEGEEEEEEGPAVLRRRWKTGHRTRYELWQKARRRIGWTRHGQRSRHVRRYVKAVNKEETSASTQECEGRNEMPVEESTSQ